MCLILEILWYIYHGINTGTAMHKIDMRPRMDKPITASHHAWWRHQMKTFSVSLAFCVGNSPVTGEFPSQRPVMWSFDISFDLCINKWLSKNSRRRWFEMPLHELWCHCNGKLLAEVKTYVVCCTYIVCCTCIMCCTLIILVNFLESTHNKHPWLTCWIKNMHVFCF